MFRRKVKTTIVIPGPDSTNDDVEFTKIILVGFSGKERARLDRLANVLSAIVVK